MTFGHAVFSKLELAHPKYLVENIMPTAYKNLDFCYIILVIDARKFKITGFTDLQRNALFLTTKAVIQLRPYHA